MKGDPKLDDDDGREQREVPPRVFAANSIPAGRRGGKRWWGGEPLWQARRACVYF